MVVVVVVVAVVAVVVVKVLVEARVGVDVVVVELFFIDPWAEVVIKSLSKVVVPVPYFVEALSDTMVKLSAVGNDFEVLADVNVSVSAVVMTAFDFPMSIP